MNRFLVLFAREPARQAREKGLGSEAAEVFRGFTAGWLEAARQTGAQLVVATPPEDIAAWRQVFRGAPDWAWIRQRGGTFGLRLEDAARRAAALGGHSVFVGGDVAPSASTLSEAFGAVEEGADAIVPPAADLDDRAALRALLRQEKIPVSLIPIARRALARFVFSGPRARRRPLTGALHGPPVLRGPPLSA